MSLSLLELVDRIAKKLTEKDLQELRSRIEAIERGIENYPPLDCIEHIKDILKGNCITY